MAKIKYGQIGVGHAHANKFSVYRASSEYEIVGVVEPDEGLRKRAMGSPLYRDVKWMTQEQLLNSPGLQVVGVETRVEDLLKVAEAAVNAGMHIHLDKPAGESLPQFKRILNTAAQKHLTVQMGYMYRYNPGIVLLRDLLKRGWLGEPFELHTVMSKLSGPSVRKQLARFKGGTMFELGCHIIDLTVGLLGKPEKVHAFPRHSAKAEDSLNDNMLAVFEYPSATATIRSSINEVDGGRRRHLVLCGSEGTCQIQPLDNPEAELTLIRSRGKYRKGYQRISFPKYVRYVDDAADLAKIVRQEKESDFSYEHDLNVQTAVLAASGL